MKKRKKVNMKKLKMKREQDFKKDNMTQTDMNRLYTEYQSIWDANNPSRRLKLFKRIVKGYLKGYNIRHDNVGNIFIGNFDKTYPCLVAHLDSVFNTAPQNIKNWDGVIISDSGIGGDDKCGIIAILELLKKHDNINAILTVDEEVGGIGASNIKLKDIENVSYFIEIDRQGKSDIVTKISGYRITANNFIDDISHLLKSYKFKATEGLYTDIYDLAIESSISSINLSCGYYNPHTKNEYVILKELQHTINFINEILLTTRKKYKIPLVENSYFTPKPCLYDDSLEYINDIDDLIETVKFYGDYTIEDIAKRAYEIGKEKGKQRRYEDIRLTNSQHMLRHKDKYKEEVIRNKDGSSTFIFK